MSRFEFLTNGNSVWGRWLPRLFVIFWVLFSFDKADVIPKLDQRPVGEHLWAQLDRASVALCYYMDDAPFLLPRCHQTSFNEEGITAGEFPLIPYTVSKLYKLFGPSEKAHRVLVLLITLLGVAFAYGVMVQLIGSAWWAAAVTAIWLTSPNLILYSISFLPDGPAMAFSLAAIFFLLRTEHEENYNLIAFGFFFALAGLLKLTAVAVLLPVVFAFVLKDLNHDRIISTLRRIIWPTLVALGIIVSWLIYARWLNAEYHSFTFLLGALPPKSMTELIDGIETFLALKTCYYDTGFWWFLLAGTLLTLAFVRRSDRMMGLATIGLYLSFTVMFVVLFEKSPTHMYYWVPFQLIVLFHVGWMFKTFKSMAVPKGLSLLVFVGATILINYDGIQIHRNVKARWTHSLPVYENYFELEQKLDELGVTYEARVFSYDDRSFNNSLYYMNRKGSVAYSNTSRERMHQWLGQCTHAVLNDTSLVSDPEFKHYFYEQIGTHKALKIFKLNADKRTDS